MLSIFSQNIDSPVSNYKSKSYFNKKNHDQGFNAIDHGFIWKGFIRKTFTSGNEFVFITIR